MITTCILSSAHHLHYSGGLPSPALGKYINIVENEVNIIFRIEGRLAYQGTYLLSNERGLVKTLLKFLLEMSLQGQSALFALIITI